MNTRWLSMRNGLVRLIISGGGRHRIVAARMERIATENPARRQVAAAHPLEEGVEVLQLQALRDVVERYKKVVKDESGAAYHSDAVESHVVFDPIVPEVQ